MSFMMWARPRPKVVPDPVGFTQLKYVIRELGLLAHDGSCREGPYVLTPDLIPYFQGVAAAGSRETKTEAATMVDMLRANPQGVLMWIGDWNDPERS